MRISTLPVVVIAMLLTAVSLRAQDIHFSQYYTHASSLNPALVGNYDGSYRLSAIYRNQWGNALGKAAFQTIGADVDFCMLEGYLRSDKLAIGVGFFSDRSGTAGLAVNNLSLSLAYHKGFGKQGAHRLSVALQGAFLQKSMNDPLFGDQFVDHNSSILNASQEDFKRSFYNFDFNAGLYWRSNIKDRVKIGVGFGAHHLIEPKESIVHNDSVYINSDDYRLPRRFVADLNLEIFMGKKKRVSIAPEFVFMHQGPFNEMLPGLFLGYYFSTGFRTNNSLHVGARFRMGGPTPDAVVPMVQIEFRNIRLGVSSDVNISTLKQSTRNFGGFEISLTYIGETIKSFKANKSLPSRRF